MKHALFEALGNGYPFSLQQKYPHVIKKLVTLWTHPKIDAYFTSLLIDTRGGRKGFDDDAFQDIRRLFEFHNIEKLHAVEGRTEARNELDQLSIPFVAAEFLKAVNQGSKRIVDLFVRGGININVRNMDGESALQIALRNGFTIIAHILLGAGADADVKNTTGLTTLQVVCEKKTPGYQELAEQLIMVGADVNVHDQKGWTPLMRAISTADQDMVALLLKNGANPFLATPKGDDALALAKKFGCEEIIELVAENQLRRNSPRSK
jgi:ankyrin repeat protein